MPRIATAAAIGVATALVAGAATALAQQPAQTTPTTTAPTAPAGPPALSSLRLPRVISAQQGHARFLVGIKLATPAKLTVQVAKPDGSIAQTSTDASDRPAGRTYLRIEAVDGRGFQLLPGRYRIRLQATDAQNRTSAVVQRAFQLKLTAPRGMVDAYTVPLVKAFQRQAGTTAQGQLIAVVGPKGAFVGSGLRRGDVVTSLNGTAITSPGVWTTVLRALPASTPVPITYVRKGQTVQSNVTLKPDWTAAPNYAASLAVAVKREPRVVAYRVAQARQRLDAGAPAEALKLWAGWPKAWRVTAQGELLRADVMARQGKWKPALGAYNRARTKDPKLAAAWFGRGVALSALDRDQPSLESFQTAVGLDPADAASLGYQAYAEISLQRYPEAVASAARAVRLDPRYADAFLPYGIALAKTGDRAGALKALRRGLILLDDAQRAATVISEDLNPLDP
ncbi:MAG: tetratricopeptide repeat protein [Thermoleophilia bacterium]